MIYSFKKNNGGGGYVLPKASATQLGGIKVGENLTIDNDGVLSANGGGSSDILEVRSAFPTSDEVNDGDVVAIKTTQEDKKGTYVIPISAWRENPERGNSCPISDNTGTNLIFCEYWGQANYGWEYDNELLITEQPRRMGINDVFMNAWKDNDNLYFQIEEGNIHINDNFVGYVNEPTEDVYGVYQAHITTSETEVFKWEAPIPEEVGYESQILCRVDVNNLEQIREEINILEYRGNGWTALNLYPYQDGKVTMEITGQGVSDFVDLRKGTFVNRMLEDSFFDVELTVDLTDESYAYIRLINKSEGEKPMRIHHTNDVVVEGTSIEWIEVGANFELPVATQDTLGVIKVGGNLLISQDGTLDAYPTKLYRTFSLSESPLVGELVSLVTDDLFYVITFEKRVWVENTERGNSCPITDNTGVGLLFCEYWGSVNFGSEFEAGEVVTNTWKSYTQNGVTISARLDDTNLYVRVKEGEYWRISANFANHFTYDTIFEHEHGVYQAHINDDPNGVFKWETPMPTELSLDSSITCKVDINNLQKLKNEQYIIGYSGDGWAEVLLHPYQDGKIVMEISGQGISDFIELYKGLSLNRMLEDSLLSIEFTADLQDESNAYIRFTNKSEDTVHINWTSDVIDESLEWKQLAFKDDVPTSVSELPNDAKYVSSEMIVSIWKGTQAQFDAIETKDNNILYIIVD